MLSRPEVIRALKRVDNNILKLDSAVEETMRQLDRPNNPHFTVNKAISDISEFGVQGIIQTMFTYGSHNGVNVDNTTDAEIKALIEAYRVIKPGKIMIYSIDRKTPEKNLYRVSREKLEEIGARIQNATGIPVSIA